MSKLNIVLIPPFMVKHINSGLLTLNDLGNIKKLRSILSDVSVAKFYSLNSMATYGTKNPQDNVVADLLNLNHLKVYVDNPIKDVPEEIIHLSYGFNGPLDYLCEVGDEKLNEVLASELSHYALRFDVELISNKTYGVMFKTLCEVSSTAQRDEMFRDDLDSLLKKASEFINDSDLINEGLYQEYLSTM